MNVSETGLDTLRRDDSFLRREYRRVLFPIMFSVLGGTINALIDSLMVSLKLGSSGISAVTFSMPVYLVLCMMGSLVAAGGAMLSARMAGRDKMDGARNMYHTALTAAFGLGVLSAVLGLVFLGPLSGLLAGASETRGLVTDYCRVTLIGAPVFVLSYIPLNYLQLEGKNAAISRMIVIMVLLDVALDALLLFVIPMGMTGAALASLISMLISCAYGFVCLQTGFSNYRFSARLMNLHGLADVLRFGSPAALGNLYDAVKLLIVNSAILSMGGESAAAVWAVLNTLSELSLVLVVGIPRAGSAMMGVYHAARENSGVRLLVRIECTYGLMMSGAFTVLLLALSGPIGAVYDVSAPMLLPLACLGVSVIVSVLCGILETSYNAAGRIVLSNVCVALRRLAMPVLCVLACAALKLIPWVFLPAAALLSLGLVLVITQVLAARSRATAHPLSSVLLLDDYLDREHKVLDFSIPPEIGRACDASERIVEFCSLNDMSPKQTMRLSLAIEELLTVLITKTPGIGAVDLRAFALEGSMGIRVRCSGKNYDPFTDEESDEESLMGIRMLEKMADVTTHTYTLGTNTLNIVFERE